MEHIDRVCSLDSKLFLISICSIRTLNILEVIVKMRFFKNRKMLNPEQSRLVLDLSELRDQAVQEAQ